MKIERRSAVKKKDRMGAALWTRLATKKLGRTTHAQLQKREAYKNAMEFQTDHGLSDKNR